jgi:7,8-dihydropterin-6-yl-methyl-4-(beta-D-ribofuranosyl)aminobenzene 5'-phosphate synthase
MSEKLSITALVENTAEGAGLLGMHGVSFWIERNGKAILFDTGQGQTLENNARILNIPVYEKAEALVLSHGHYDHTGGLDKFMASSHKTVLYAHPDAFGPKFSRKFDGLGRSIQMPGSRQDLQAWKEASIPTNAPMEIIPGVFVTGPIPRDTAYEDTGGDFYLDESCTQPDPMIDDQALYCRTANGLVVVLGCAHAGVINTLYYIETLTGGVNIEAVIGGMHLLHASEDRIAQTVAELKNLNVGRVYPSHCTGQAAIAAMREAFGDHCLPCHVGTILTFPTS